MSGFLGARDFGFLPSGTGGGGGGGITSVCTNNTTTFSFYGDGTCFNPLCGCPTISSCANNGLTVCPDGLYVCDNGGGGGNAVIILGAGLCSSVRCAVNNSTTGSYSAAFGGQCNVSQQDWAVITGGFCNTNSGIKSFIGGGQENIILLSNNNSIVGGGSNLINGDSDYSVISGGQQNQVDGDYSALGGGCTNIAQGRFNFIGSGLTNRIYGEPFVPNISNFNFIGSGETNTICCSCHNFIGSGNNNKICCASYNFIGSGQNNITGSSYALTSNSFIGSGFSNAVLSKCSAIVSGFTNIASGDMSFIGSGCCNLTACLSFIGAGSINCTQDFSGIVSGCNNEIGGTYSFIGSGACNTISNSYAFIGAGCCNISSGNTSSIIGGFSNYIQGDFGFIGNGICNNLCNTSGCLAFGSVVVGGAGNNTGGGTWDTTFCCFTVAPTILNAGQYSFIGGGFQNVATGCFGTVVSGSCNSIISGISSVIVSGLRNFSTANCGFIGNGRCNNTSSNYTSVINGCNNRALGCYSSVVNGDGNCSCCSYSFIGSGFANESIGNFSFQGNGQRNRAIGFGSFGGGGSNNTTSGVYAFTAHGCQQTNSGYGGFIGNGFFNILSGCNSFIGNGCRNTASGCQTFIGNGICNCSQANFGHIGNGICNNVINSISGCNGLGSVVVGGVGNNTCGGTWNLPTCSFTVAPTICNTGQYSFIGGGFQNRVESTGSVVVGGCCNVSGFLSFVGSGCCNINGNTANLAFIGNGFCNRTCCQFSLVVGGTCNTVVGDWAAIIGGSGNKIDTCYSSINNGINNCVCFGATQSSILNGCQNIIRQGINATIINGRSNQVCANCATISGGYGNNTTSGYAFIGNGRINCHSDLGRYKTIVNGQLNCIRGDAWYGFIGGGQNNFICNNTGFNLGGGNGVIVGGSQNGNTGCHAFIGNGCGNTISGEYGALVGGRGNTLSGGGGGGGFLNFPSFIGGGNGNVSSGCASNVVGGVFNTASSNLANIVGGFSNLATSCFSNVLGGNFNTINAGCQSSIISGSGNIINQCESFNSVPSFIGSGIFNYLGQTNNYKAFCTSGIVQSIFISGDQTANFSVGNCVVYYNQCTKYSPRGCVCSVTFDGINTKLCVPDLAQYTGFNCFGLTGGIVRNLSTSVPRGYGNVIIGGCNNIITGRISFIGSGIYNFNDSDFGFIGNGVCNNICSISDFGAVVVGGVGNNTVGGTWDLPTCTFTISPTICNAGEYSFIGNGFQNRATGTRSSVLGGQLNDTCGFADAMIIGSCLCASQACTTFVNCLSAANLTSGCAVCVTTNGVLTNYTPPAIPAASIIVLGGGTCSSVRCGVNNTASGNCSAAFSGCNNTASNNLSLVISGVQNTTSGAGSTITNGARNTASGYYDFIGNGTDNSTSQNFSFVGSGFCNISDGIRSSILNGQCNKICGFADAHIVGSCICASQACTTFVNCLSAQNLTTGCAVCVGSNNILENYTPAPNAVIVLDSGTNSSVRCGVNNCASGADSAALSGGNNTATANFSLVVGGEFNDAHAPCSTIVGGFCNDNCGCEGAFIGGGRNNIIACLSDHSAVIGGGFSNTICCHHSGIIGGGQSNTLFGGGGIALGRSGIFSGCANTICNNNGADSFIGGGLQNSVTGQVNSISGGKCNTISSNYSGIVGGCANTVSSNYSAILGGKQNSTSTFCDTFIIGSCLTASQACTTFVNCLSAANLTAGCAVCVTTNGVLTNYTPAVAVSPIIILDSGACSSVRCGVNNCASGNSAGAFGGCNNTASANFSGILGGRDNNTSTFSDTFIVGSNLTSVHPCTTYVNCLSADNLTVGCALCVGTHKIIESFTPPPNGVIIADTGLISSVRCGGNNCASGNQSGVLSGCSNTASASHSAILGGCGNNTSTFADSFIVGSNLTSTQACTTFVNCLSAANLTAGCAVCVTTNGVLTNYTPVVQPSPIMILDSGTVSTVRCGGGNCASGNYSGSLSGCLNLSSASFGTISGGCSNTVSSNYSGILGGKCNSTSTFCDTFIIGSNITASQACTTFVNCLAACNLTSGCQVCVGVNGVLVNFAGGGGGGTGIIVLDSGNCSSVRCSVNNCASGAFSGAFGGCANTASANYSAILGGCGNNTSTFADSFIIGSNLTSTQACTTFVNCLSAANLTVGCQICVGANGVLVSFSGGGGGGGIIILDTGTCSSVRCGVLNCASGAYSAALGGCCNTASANYSAILGGKQNSTSSFCDSFIIGSCLTSTQSCTTFVNCLSAANLTSGCAVCVGVNGVLNNYTPAPNGVIILDSGTLSAVRCGANNCASGNCSGVLSGCGNTASANYSAILGGKGNNTSTFADSFIVGSNLTASQACTTFVNCLSAANLTNGCAVCVTTNGVLTNYTPAPNGVIILDSGTLSAVRCGANNCASGNQSGVLSGCSNTASAANSAILGGCGNNTSTFADSFIVGSNLTASQACTTFVNCLSAANLTNGCAVCVTTNGVLTNYTPAPNGVIVLDSGTLSAVRCGANNCASGNCSGVLSGCGNTASANYSAILGGKGNNTSTFADSFIVGSNLTASQACTTFVNCLSAANLTNGCQVCVGANGVLINSATPSIACVTTASTNTFSFYGDGTAGSPLCGCPIISSAASQGIQALPDGLWSPLPIRTGLVYGGIVTWITGYTYNVSSAGYYINGVFYTSPSTNVTLTPADPTLDRIDLFVLTTSGTATFISGTPAIPPQAPTINPNNEIEISFAFVAAGSTSPVIASQYLYFNNAEWTAVSNSGNINVASTNNPFSPPLDIEATSAVSGNSVTLTTSPAFNILNTYTNLIFYIRSKSTFPNPKRLEFTWRNGITVVGATINVSGNSVTYGFDSSNTTTYQRIAIPLTDFGLTTASVVDNLVIAVGGGGSSVGFYLDNIEIQSGAPAPAPALNLYTPSLGTCSTIRCNVANTASSNYSSALGGRCNIVNTNSNYSSILSGFCNTISCSQSLVLNGCCNTAIGVNSVVINGRTNRSQAGFGFVGNGVCNTVCNSTSGCLALGAVVVGGVGNNSFGGSWNLASCTFTVAPTVCNAGQYSFIGGGFQNRATGTRSSVLGGQLNDTCGFADAHIVGSCICATQACTTFVNCLSAGNLTVGCYVCVGANGVLGNAVVPVVGGACGYTLTLGYNDQPTIAASTTYFTGAFFGALACTTSVPNRTILVPQSGVISKIGVMTTVQGTKAAGGFTTVTLRLRNTTAGTQNDFAIGNYFNVIGLTTCARQDLFTLSPALAVTAGDLIQIQIITPAWSTAPTNVYQLFTVYVS